MSRTDGFLPHENDWGKLGQFIGRNNHITELKFCLLMGSMFNSETREFDEETMFNGGSGPGLPRVKQFKDFCSGLVNNTSVKKVHFHDTPMILGEGRNATDGFGWAYILMSDWFENNVVEEITMPRCHCEDGNYDNSGEISKMATVLEKFSSLKVFHIEFDGDLWGESSPCEASGQIFDALSNHTNLEDVQASHDRAKWSHGGYAALARFLSGSPSGRRYDWQRSSKKVKKLGLQGGDMNDEGAIAVSVALGGNDTLKEIAFDDYDLAITSTGWTAFAKLLSDPGSIMDTYNSNHTLQRLFSSDHRFFHKNGQQETIGDELHLLLRVNTLCNKTDAARVKIIMRHLNGDFSMEPFASMDLPALPHALAYMGRMNADIASLYKFAEADLGLMFKLVRGVAPVLFDSSPLTGNKRKAQQV